MNRYVTLLSFFLLFLSMIHSSCARKKEGRTPPAFDLNNPEKFTMPSSLLEISGISFHKGRKDTIYGIQDEAGKLFRMTWGVRKPRHTKFAGGGDYEDLAIINNKVIVLKSNGTLLSFAKDDQFVEEVDSVAEWRMLLPEGEYEGLYGDEASSSLYVLCKKCDADDNQDIVSGYILKVNDSIRRSSEFSINVAEIKPFSKKAKSGFRPSGLAKDPLTGEWFVISASNKLLVITDSGWKVKEAYPLNGNTFYQPEGIAFDSEGTLYISNEGDELSDGNVLRFARRIK